MRMFIKWLISWLTMKRKHCLFIDRIDGQEVFLWIDCYGQEWMAHYSKWGFRVSK